MSHVRKDLQVEPLFTLSQDLRCSSALICHEELIGSRHGQEDGCFHMLAIGCSMKRLALAIPLTLDTWLSITKDGWAIAPAEQIPAEESCSQTNRAPQLESC
jgi:hypothetical protein